MIKFLNIYPPEFNLKNLHDKQKAFLIYLIGSLPSLEAWQRDVQYQSEKLQIEELTIEDVELSESDQDLMKIQGQNIDEMKKERLKKLIKQKEVDLNKKYGMIDETLDEIEQLNKRVKDLKEKTGQMSVFDMVHGKGIVKKNGL